MWTYDFRSTGDVRNGEYKFIRHDIIIIIVVIIIIIIIIIVVVVIIIIMWMTTMTPTTTAMAITSSPGYPEPRLQKYNSNVSILNSHL